jgi:ribosomal protein S18 acetylase RimI-like enzyme
MATGLDHPQWNSADIDDPETVDVDAVARWYAERGVRWGLRVPAGAPWPHGRFLVRKRLMGLSPEGYRPAGPAEDVTLRAATHADVAAVVAVDREAFGDHGELQQTWIELLFRHRQVTYVVAERSGVVAGVGYSQRTDEDAGPALFVGGIGVRASMRRRGIGSAVSSWLVTAGFDAGARLAHLHPDTEDAARIYRRLGFVEVDGLDIYLP